MNKFYPQLGQQYYVPSFMTRCKSAMLIWEDSDTNQYHMYHNLVCKTRDQAVAITNAAIDNHKLTKEHTL